MAYGTESDEDEKESCVTLYRTVPAGKYTPGEALTVILRAESNCEDEFGSLGFTETVSQGWSFVDVGAIRGEKPPIFPEAGKTGDLEFCWIHVPEFPVEFQYVIKSSKASKDPLIITGSALYYFTVGGVNQSAGIETTVESFYSVEEEGEGSTVTEGEVNGEGEHPQEGEAGDEGELLGEGEPLLEGEVNGEGEHFQEGEAGDDGELLGEGEPLPDGEVLKEGETEGQSETEGEDEEQNGLQSGCCRGTKKSPNSGFNGNSAMAAAGDILLFFFAAGCLSLKALIK